MPTRMQDAVTTGQAQRLIRKFLTESGVETAELDARLLTGQVTGMDDTALIMCENDPLPAAQFGRLEELARKRAAGVPVSRLMHRREFFSLSFQLSKDTLDPRPDSEVLVAQILKQAGNYQNPKLLDLGTGSGCLLIACLAHCSDATGLGIDISRGALRQARINAALNGVCERAAFRQGDWLDGLDRLKGGRQGFDLILSNPPYIPHADIAGLAREVKDHDPWRALDGGSDGLDIYRRIIPEMKPVLNKGGFAAVEVGEGQAETVAGIFSKSGYRQISVVPDLSGVARVVSGFSVD